MKKAAERLMVLVRKDIQENADLYYAIGRVGHEEIRSGVGSSGPTHANMMHPWDVTIERRLAPFLRLVPFRLMVVCGIVTWFVGGWILTRGEAYGWMIIASLLSVGMWALSLIMPRE